MSKFSSQVHGLSPTPDSGATVGAPGLGVTIVGIRAGIGSLRILIERIQHDSLSISIRT